MDIRIYPSKVDGTITAPPSKSITHRAIILASLAMGKSQLKNVLLAADTLNTIKACQAMGVDIQTKDHNLLIAGTGGKLYAPKNPLNLGNSGTSMRMMAGVAAIAQGTTILTGEQRLCERPMQDLLISLQDLSIDVESINNNGAPPIKITGGQLKGGIVKIPGNISSQYITALLLISPFAQNTLKIIITGELKSKPYVALTIDVMKAFGVEVKNHNFEEFVVESGQTYKATDYNIEGDYSSASYFFAAAAITGRSVTVKNLTPNSHQGDAKFLSILKKMGCAVTTQPNSITVKGPLQLKPININLGDNPDLVQTLAVIASLAKGTTKITNLGHLKYKETDRLNAPAKELKKMGIETSVNNNSLTIFGGQPTGAVIETHNDHRMAMSFAVLALAANGPTVIKNAEVVEKSYPDFFQDFAKINVKMEKVS